MQLKIVIALFCVGVAVNGAAVQTYPKLLATGQADLMNFFMKSRSVSEANPSTSMECFNYYIPLLNDIAGSYEKNYLECVNVAASAKSDVDNKTTAERQKLDNLSTSSCEALSTCTTETSTLDAFTCYSNAGSENTKTMYTISTEATDVLAALKVAYAAIDATQTTCLDTCERVYVKDTANTYENLQNCLDGKTSVPTANPTNPAI